MLLAYTDYGFSGTSDKKQIPATMGFNKSWILEFIMDKKFLVIKLIKEIVLCWLLQATQLSFMY